MSNEEHARAMTSLDTYERIIEVYEKRTLADEHRPWFETMLRQRDLKRKEESC